MKRLLLVAATVALLLVPAAAQAASGTSPTLRGTVVAKDTAHRSLVVAVRSGAVRTIAAPGSFARVDVGGRVVVRYRNVPGGLPVALTVGTTGRAARALVRGTVLRVAGGRAILNAGGSALSVKLAAPKRQRQLSASGSGLAAGDVVKAELEIHADGSLDANKVVVTEAGASSSEISEAELEVRGTVVSLSPALVVKTGTGVVITCVLPTGAVLTGIAVGELVEVKCDLVGGQWTLRKTHAEDDHEDEEENEDEGYGHGTSGDDRHDTGKIEVEGTLTSLDPLIVTPAGSAAVTCRIPAGVSLRGFELGEIVELKCRTIHGTLTVDEIEAVGSDDEENEDEVNEEDGDNGDHDDESGGDDE